MRKETCVNPDKNRKTSKAESGDGVVESGRVMVLGKVQCIGIQLIWTTVDQGSAVLAVGAGGTAFFSSPIIFF